MSNEKSQDLELEKDANCISKEHHHAPWKADDHGSGEKEEEDDLTKIAMEILNTSPKRPVLKLKLDQMPTPQQAEHQAQRAADAGSDAKSSRSNKVAALRLHLKSMGSESECASGKDMK